MKAPKEHYNNVLRNTKQRITDEIDSLEEEDCEGNVFYVLDYLKREIQEAKTFKEVRAIVKSFYSFVKKKDRFSAYK